MPSANAAGRNLCIRLPNGPARADWTSPGRTGTASDPLQIRQMLNRFIGRFTGRFMGALLCAAVFVSSSTSALAQVDPHGAMLRYPDVSADKIAFAYADDLWVVSREGGLASPLAAPSGLESFPRFSPDGSVIAFTGNYDGNRDLYTVPTNGGVPVRVTYHPTGETLCDWTPEGLLLFQSRGSDGLGKRSQLFTVPKEGGLPERLPVPYGAFGTVHSAGAWLAYVPWSRDGRTWKRYRGGMASDVWLFNLITHESKRVTDWEGTDSLPMWNGDDLYYLSDAGPNHRLNIWHYDQETGGKRQITTFGDYDVKWPSIGPGPDGKGEIVFQHGSELLLLDLETNESRRVEVQIPGARPSLRPNRVDAAEFISSYDISPSGKRVVSEARGDIWTLPAENGVPRNLTQSSGVFERDPSWSPDGRWIAYLSDETGEYELYIKQSDGKLAAQQLTTGGDAFRYGPKWSPDSKKILFTDKAGSIFLVDVESRELKTVDRDPWANGPGGSVQNWSSDSRWIVYERAGDDTTSISIWLYNVEEGISTQVTDGMFNDENPVFDKAGKYLFFKSNRHFSPQYDDLGSSFIYAGSEVLLCVPLSDETASPFAPKSDEQDWDDEDAEEEDDEDEESGDDDSDEDDDESDEDDEDDVIEPIDVDLDGFERRAIRIPIDPGSFGMLEVNSSDQLIYVRRPVGGGEATIHLFDFEDDDHEEQVVVEGAGGYHLSADGEKILFLKDGKAQIADASKDAEGIAVVTSGMKLHIQPRAEWAQIFTEAWRLHRDFFYDPNMHGVDWPAVKDQYESMLADCVTRQDLSYVLREMVSELNVGHAYYSGGDVEKGPRENVGMLAADFEVESGMYKFAHIQEGAKWDVDARGPLSQPGVEDLTGKFLHAVNGVRVDVSKDPSAWFQGLAGKNITLTVADSAARDDESIRDLVVKALGSERDIRYRAWIEMNRAYVEAQTDGQVGYIYVPDTGVNGQNNLVRQFYGQIGKAALIIDERWNGGGQIPTRFIELLNRPITNYWARRDGLDWSWPPDGQQGPKCMLINGLAGSGGDAFPAYFRQAGLGKLIGMRTWGGLVGMTGTPALIDGGSVTVPSFGYYETDGTWGIEGHGVDPDMEVIDDPALMMNGGDPQLDAAIAHMLEELKTRGYVKPDRPAGPDRSGMGLPKEEH